MGYSEALEAAGAEVLAYEEFGSYQGDWWARVKYNGESGYVTGSFGSCSGCDAFQAEFDYYSEPHTDFELWRQCGHHLEQNDDRYDLLEDTPENRERHARELAETQKKLAEFGRSYLRDVLTKEEALAEMSRNLEWDREAQTMVDWWNTQHLEEAREGVVEGVQEDQK